MINTLSLWIGLAMIALVAGCGAAFEGAGGSDQIFTGARSDGADLSAGKDGGSNGAGGADGDARLGADGGEDGGGWDAGEDSGGGSGGWDGGEDGGEDGSGEGGDAGSNGGSSGDSDKNRDSKDVKADNLRRKNLVEPMLIKQIGAGDEGSKLVIAVVAKDGMLDPQTTVFKEREKTQKQSPDSCKKKGITTISLTINGKSFPGRGSDAENYIWTRQGDAVKLVADLQGDCTPGGLFSSTCVELATDDGWIFECPGGRIEVEGTQI